ncbi:MlaD family protein [Rhabdochromatium marinum]|uniref:MlaD family protein n=1 Tax=Rhabdochromatium marinum TaxID=48729 RepID=UPI00190588D1|nr:MlaD family protein [Rhabdochromatium marinum]MBK1650423.1 hypothetical protein [Rhabdochromatium marinum]
MSKQANPAIIGGFVLGALLLFVGALIVLGSGALLRERIEVVTFFPGSVQGLNTGTQVHFQGVPIGQVTKISLDYLPGVNSFRIPVRYDVWPQNVDVMSGRARQDARSVIRKLVKERGLRARLESISLVTGQYVVTLSLNPRLPPPAETRDYQGAIQVPAIEATRDRVEELITNLPLNDLVDQTTGTLTAIHQLFASGQLDQAVSSLDQTLTQSRLMLQTLNQDLPPLLNTLQQLLTHYDELAVAAHEQLAAIAPAVQQAATNTAQLSTRLEQDWGPLSRSARSALDQASHTLATVDQLVARDSPTRYQLDQLLREGTQAVRSIRTLAEYLERHPEALLNGKPDAGSR